MRSRFLARVGVLHAGNPELENQVTSPEPSLRVTGKLRPNPIDAKFQTLLYYPSSSVEVLTHAVASCSSGIWGPKVTVQMGWSFEVKKRAWWLAAQ